jgi:hypothetical protein
MTNPQNTNGKHTPADKDDDYPGPLLAVAHRDPEALMEIIEAFRRLLASAGEEPFTPCTDPCPLCQPALWLTNSY